MKKGLGSSGISMRICRGIRSGERVEMGGESSDRLEVRGVGDRTGARVNSRGREFRGREKLNVDMSRAVQ